MSSDMQEDQTQIIEIIREGGVGVLPTDTLYGLVGSALSPDAVDRIYDLKQRDPSKPLIVLIADIEELERFGIVISDMLLERLSGYWPGPNSVVLPTIDDQFEYLDRGRGSIAFRLPAHDELRALLRMTGPLVAPSANVEGAQPAITIEMARAYFGSDASFYVDAGELKGKASTLIEFDGDDIRILRD